jgi:cytochrome c biogenesis protein CcdA
VYIAFFNTPGCEGCEAGERALEEATEGLPDVEVIRYDSGNRHDFELFEVLADRAHLDATQLAVAPSLFITTDYLDLRTHSADDVRRLIARYQPTGTPRFFEASPEELANAQINHIQRFQRFSVVAIALAGLVDGINPCAFATVLFLLSYLAWLGRSRRDILLTGLFFALGIFTPYYLIGVGALHFSRELTALPVLKHWLFEAAAAAALVFAVLSFLDALKARAGNASAMTLRLPRLMRTRIHEAVKDSTRPGMIGGAFLAGAVCALLEAVCTGQIYLPTLVYIAGVASLRSRALLYLLLYNAAFLVPLLIVVGVVYGGLSSRTIGKFAEARTVTVKLALGTIFVILAALLHFSS